ncbi:MAG: AAA family ATPase, partial [Erysipelotrichaceae bacterium]|nr:AAA family ATPase [Erysipelotrichaceae bacterium]
IYAAILEFCVEPRSKVEILEYCGYKNARKFTQNYLWPLLDEGKLKMTLPDKPTSRNQKYIAVQEH